MNFAILAPFVRVQVFGAVVWALANLGLPASQADAYTDWTMAGLALFASTAYGAYASWRERKAALVHRMGRAGHLRSDRGRLPRTDHRPHVQVGP